MSKALFTPPSARDLWREAGAFLHGHAELPSQASRIRGFGAGARWMHAAMRAAGWSLPPFGGERRHQRHGVLKYAVCLVGAVAVLALSPWIGLPRAIPVSVAIFYTLEAQAVFLFPETLRGSRSPWASSRAMVVVAGGTWRVMRTVIPIAVRMLLGGLRRRGLAATWAQGCVAVVLWHRRVAQERRTHLDSPRSLPRLELGPANPLLLRREHVRAGLRQGFRVLWISDLHWRGPGDASCLLAIFGIVRREGPDLVVLGGDFLEREAAHPLGRRGSLCRPARQSRPSENRIATGDYSAARRRLVAGRGDAGPRQFARRAFARCRRPIAARRVPGDRYRQTRRPDPVRSRSRRR